MKLSINKASDEYEQEADRIANQVPAGPAHLAGAGARIHIQRFTGQATGQTATVPTSVGRVLAKLGRPLDRALQQEMEQRFDHDFSRVRVHSDATAEQSAQDLNASAYTVGHDIVFGAGQFAPGTNEGRRLIAHELTHVVQQESSLSAGSLQRQERRPRPAPVDAAAQRIIDLAQDTTTPIDQRAVAVVQAIINQYFPADASKINGVNYSDGGSGLVTSYTGGGAATTGTIHVGGDFVENTDQRNFARRVLQVRHEIEHVEQVRSGMVGESRSDEREFIAFYHGALAQELPGTGRMQHGTRVNLIDGALGYYYCLSSELQSANATRRDELLARRAEEVRRSHSTDLGEAPTTCRRQPGDRGPSGRGAQSEGLSAGAIAGIVLGSVALAAGIGLGIAALAGAF